jgi:hypothetical protein
VHEWHRIKNLRQVLLGVGNSNKFRSQTFSGRKSSSRQNARIGVKKHYKYLKRTFSHFDYMHLINVGFVKLVCSFQWLHHALTPCGFLFMMEKVLEWTLWMKRHWELCKWHDVCYYDDYRKRQKNFCVWCSLRNIFRKNEQVFEEGLVRKLCHA